MVCCCRHRRRSFSPTFRAQRTRFFVCVPNAHISRARTAAGNDAEAAVDDGQGDAGEARAVCALSAAALPLRDPA